MMESTAEITRPMDEKSKNEMSLEEKLDWCTLSYEEIMRRAVPPFTLWSNKGRYKDSRHWTTFDVREYDALGRELGSYDVKNQRKTAMKEGKKTYFYVWSCSCHKENCRHINHAKRIYWAEWKKKKDAEAWLLDNDPSYITPKMAAAGYISWGAGAKRAKEEGLI